MGHLFLGVENGVGKTHLRKLGNLRKNMHISHFYFSLILSLLPPFLLLKTLAIAFSLPG